MGVVGYSSSDIDPVCRTTGYTRPISQLLGTVVATMILCTQPLRMPAMILMLGAQPLGK